MQLEREAQVGCITERLRTSSSLTTQTGSAGITIETMVNSADLLALNLRVFNSESDLRKVREQTQQVNQLKEDINKLRSKVNIFEEKIQKLERLFEDQRLNNRELRITLGSETRIIRDLMHQMMAEVDRLKDKQVPELCKTPLNSPTASNNGTFSPATPTAIEC
ncbi:hypothetical protein QQS21_008614 [Conoideocrella luteorostrata]|uniref:Uncharacterized protein n=1 Tax=Conoideocrella luteorostrata TaxID=1105319 RepID=A0AAJ0CIJ6_9HYPO|nr:hypothetical protein QQS21_008614 [Conoideocrella luteorostrata]